METEVITTRLPRKYVSELQRLAREEHLGRSALIRKMLLSSIEEYLLKKAAESYQQGDISLEEAAVRAEVSLWRMIEYLRKHNITPPPETLKGMEEGLKRTEEIMKRVR
ncbi:MAG: hypothetical protein B6U86_00070 [Candidatus Altiarchaeales archaeon ex4484_43]|nr:MAG: hypothetical protein B6U86_00070 [Candidatus Altiarchaeales archaeon ex4484_43]